MEKICLLLFFLFSVTLNAQDISIEEAYKLVSKNDASITSKNVYYSPKILNPKENIEGFKNITSPDYKSWCFFVDEYPYQDWEHSCYYAFVNYDTEKLEIVKAKIPPKLSNFKAKVTQPIPPSGKLFDFNKKGSNLKSATTYDASNDYAVIINGGWDDENNYIRYWNHCSAVYSALVNVYNYSPSHIYVLMADGTSSGKDRVLSLNPLTRDSSPLDLDGDGTNDIQYSATKANIGTVFNSLSNLLDEEDHLFIYTTDHGGQSSGDSVHLYLWDDTMTDDEFAAEINKVNAGKITTTLVQCHSGGFINELEKENRVITTSCSEDESAYTLNWSYSEFTYHWISAIAGETPEGTPVDADDNNDGWVSMREAFEYAQDNDSYVDGVFVPGFGTVSETPQYSSTPADLGCFVRLSDNWNWHIGGPSVVCTDGTYTVNDVPDGATVTWENCSSILSLPSNTAVNPGIIGRIGNGGGWVEASINNTCGSLVLPRKYIWAGEPTSVGLEMEAYSPPGAGSFPTDQLCGISAIVSSHPNVQEQNITNYSWDAGAWQSYVVSSSSDQLVLNVPSNASSPHSIWLSAVNQCGPSLSISKQFEVGGCDLWSLAISPNPSDGEVSVAIVSDAPGELAAKSTESTFDETTEWELEVYSTMQRLKTKQTKIKTKEIKLNTQGWKEGVYTVRARYKGEVLTAKLVVK